MRSIGAAVGIIVIGLLIASASVRPGRAAQVTVTTTPIARTAAATASVTASPTATSIAPYLGLLTQNTERGLEVAQVVPGGPADRAGFKVGDVLTRINGFAVLPAVPLSRQLPGIAVGVAIQIEVKRGDATQTLSLIPAERPTATPAPPTPKPGGAYIGFGLVASDDGKAAKIERLIEGSPAAIAGLRVGDLITAADDQPIASPGAMQAYLSNRAPGQIVKLTVTRDGQSVVFTVTLGVVPTAGPPTPIPPTVNAAQATPGTGEISPYQPRVRFGVTYDTLPEGARVVTVEADSPAAQAGIAVGDLITKIDEDKIDAKKTLGLRLLPYLPGDSVVVTLVRADQTVTVTVKLTARGIV